MSQARGSEANFALFEEDTYGQDPGTPSGFKMYLTSFGLQKQRRNIPSQTLTPDRSMEEPMRGNVDVTGPIGMEMNAESMGMLFKHLLGSVSTTGADPYSHEFTIGDLPTSLLLEKDYGANISGSGRYEKYNGIRLARGRFQFPQEGPALASFDCVGADMAQDSSALDGSPTDNGMTPFSMFEASIQEGGGAIAVVQSAEMVLDNGLDTGQYVVGGSGVRAGLPEGKAGISGRLTALFDSTSLLNKALNDTESSLQITLTRGDGLGSAGNESMEFLVQQLKYSPNSPPINGPGGVLVNLDFIGYKSGADLGFKVTLNNAVVSY